MTTISKLLAVLSALAIVGATQPGQAQVPETLSYQGYLTDADGQASNDPVVVEFFLYTVETGGSPVWSDIQSVFPSQGLFSTTFGSDANPFPAGLFDTPLFLGVKVGVDDEMVPRRSLTTAAFSNKAKDAETLDGRTANELDQSSDIAQLNSALNSTQIDVSSLQTGLSTAQNDLSATQTDVTQLEDTLDTAEQDIATVEATLPTLQQRINGTCPTGSSIRTVNQNGTVSCETDDTGPWSFDGDAWLASGTRVGLGTSSPAAAIQIDSAVDTDPFRARVGSSTKLRVHTNGSVSMGTSLVGPENGIHVFGTAGIGTASPNAKLTTLDSNWQFQLVNPGIGGNSWYLGSSADAWSAGGGKLVFNNTDNSSSAAMVIDGNKDVGIGVLDPQTPLHVSGGSDVSTVNSGGYLTIGSVTGANVTLDTNEIMARSNGSNATLALNAEGGKVSINSGGSQDHDSLEVRGRILIDNGGNSGMRFTGTSSSPTNALLEPTLFEEGLLGVVSRPFWRIYSREFYAQSALQYRTYSDRSLKSNIEPLANAIDTVNALEGVSYRLDQHPMQTQNKTLSEQERFVQDHQIGFIAQDVEKVLPQLVTTDDTTGLKTVAYMGVIPVLVEALKAQQKQLDEQRKEIEALKNQLP